MIGHETDKRVKLIIKKYNETTHFIKIVRERLIMKGSSKSAVNRRKVVSKRVLVPEELGSSRKDVCVSLTVENLSNGFIDL